MSFDVLIVGLGNIGARYDAKLDPERFILTHARAFARSKGFAVVGGVDPNPEHRRDFHAAYGTPVFETIELALARCTPDVVVIAVPTDQHLPVIDAVLTGSDPRVVLCEKPLAFRPADAEAILRRCESAGTKLFVNYMRRADPGIKRVRALVAEGRIGAPVNGMAWYSKGMLNSASHIVDLCIFWFGRIDDVRCLAPPIDATEPDPRVPFALRLGGSTVSFMPADRSAYFINTLECLAENGRLHYDLADGTMTWRPVADSAVFAGYRNIALRETAIETDAFRVQLHVANEILGWLNGEECSLSTGSEALDLLTNLTGCITTC